MQLIVLLYHEILPRNQWPASGAGPVRTQQGVADVLPPPLYVWEDDFVAQMEYLVREGYSVVSSDAVVDAYRGGTPLPERAVLLTFDDLWKGGMTIAYPVLKRLGLPALAFLVGGWVFDQPQSLVPGSPVCLARGEWEPLADVFAFANHTNKLHTRGPSGITVATVDEATFVEDLRQCEEWTTLKGVFAYPFGAVGPGAVSGLQKEGFTLAFTTEQGACDEHTDRLRMRRNLVPCGAGLDEFAQILAR